MSQGKSVNFSVIKQKIIKTDEVLRLHMETNNKLKGAQETCKAYKLKYDQAALNLSRLQLENERCTFNLENVKLKCELLEKENEKLQEQKLTLEDKYNHQTVQSQLNIKELENELQMLQEIKTTAERFSPKKKRGSSTVNQNKKIKELEDKIKQLEESGINSKNEVTSLNVQNKKLSNDIIVTEKKHSDTIRKLQIENSDLLEELNKLKCQINEANSNLEAKSKHEATLENLNKEKDLELSELHKKIFTLVVDENKLKIIEEENQMLRQQLMDQEKHLAKENNSTKDICLQTDKLTKNHTRTIHIQTLESMKTVSQHDSISSENKKLKQTILNRDAEIFKLKAKSKVSTKHCHTQTEVLEYDVESVEDILIEMRNFIPMLSPMSTSSENLNLDDILSPISGNVNDSCPVLPDIPDIVITPPTPIKEKDFEKFTDFHKIISVPPIINENISPIEQLEKTNTDNSKNSEELENKEIKDNIKRVQRRKLFNDDNFVKLRKSCLKRMLNKRYVFKKEMRRARKLSKQDCILRALRTLKHSNINFTITNQSNVPKWWTNYNNYDSFKYPEMPPDSNQRKANTLRKSSNSAQQNKSTQYVTEKLNCISKNCDNGNSCMLLNNVQGMTELLGFFNVKNENITPSSSRIGNIADNKHLNCLKSLYPTGGSEMTPENLLETLADLVSEKLRQKKNISKRKQQLVSEKSDSFYSETETEIERLFATPDDSVLRRNKMLLKRAKEQNSRETVFASNLEGDVSVMKHANADSKSTPSKLTQGFEETQGSNTEIKSFGLDDTRRIENEDASNTTELNSANECMENSSASFKYSTCPSETNKNMVKSPSAKSVTKTASKFTESSKTKEKLENEKIFPVSTNYDIFNESTESRDSFQYSECPEIISPLSSVICKDSPQNKGILRSSQTEEVNLMEKSPFSPKCLKFSNRQNNPDPLNNSQSSSDKLLIKSPASNAYINKCVCNEKVINEQLDIFINNFEEHNSSIEDLTIPISHRNLDSSSDKPSKNEHCKIFPKDSQKNISVMEKELPKERNFVKDNFAMVISELGDTAEQKGKNGIQERNQTISPIENESNVSLGPINSSLKESQEMHLNLLNEGEEHSNPTKSNHITHLSSPLSISTVQFSEGYSQYQCNNRDSREFMEYKQFKRGISFIDSIYPVQSKLSRSPIKKITKEIVNVLPDAENNTNNLSEFNQIEDIPSCPQSPVIDYEDHMDTKVPKIIPLQRPLAHYNIIGLDGNTIENMVNSHGFLKREEIIKASESKIIPSNNERLDHVILNVLPNAENTPSHRPKTAEIEDIPNCPQSPVINYEEHTDVLRKVENTSCPQSKTNEIENIPNCPQSPVIDYEEDVHVLPKVENTPDPQSKINETEDVPSCPQSPVIDCEELMDVLPKVKNTPSSQSKTNEIEDISSSPQSPISDYDEPMDVLPKMGNTPSPRSKTNKIENIPSCPQSPVINYEEHTDVLRKVENTSGPQTKTNEIENIPSCPQSPVIDYEEDMHVLPKVENTPDPQSKINETEDVPSCPQSPVIDCEELMDVLPKVKNTPSPQSKTNEIEDVPSCPQSPINDYEEHVNIKIPKIIPLERLFEQDTVIGFNGNTTENMLTSHDFLKQEEIIKAFETKIISSNNDHDESRDQLILDVLPKVESTLNHQSKANEIENMACAPSIEKKLSFTLPQMTETLDESDFAGDFDKRNNTDDISIRSKSPESNAEYDKHIPILPLNNQENTTSVFINNKEYRTTKDLKRTAAPTSPMLLRRSKRICKMVSYSELPTGDSSESCEIGRISERLTDNCKSEDISKIPQVDPNCPVKFQIFNKSLNENFSIVSEISTPIKRKRGRPRKCPVVESNSKYEKTKTVSVDNTNCNEKQLKTTILCIEPQEEISKNKYKVLKELSREENSIAELCVEPDKENIKSNMLVDEHNFELKSDIVSESTPENFAVENRTTNLSEKCVLHHELLTEDENRITNLSEKQELHRELLTDEHNELLTDEDNELSTNTNFKEKNLKNNMAKRKQVSKEAVVRKGKNIVDMKSPDTVTLEMMSDVASEGERSYLETNEFHDDLIIDETDSEEMDDENNTKAEKLDNKNTVVTKSEKINNESLPLDVANLISDIISEEKRKISLCDESVPRSDALTIGINTEENSDKNNEAKEKLAAKNTVRKKKVMSTLKSNIIKQFRMKRKMFQMDVEVMKTTNACDLKINCNSDRSITKKTHIKNVSLNIKSNTTQRSNISESTNVDNSENNGDDKRIHIVQNIMIPANSSYAVDLMEKKRFSDSNFPLNCDIRLDVPHSSSQNDVRFSKPPLHKKKTAEGIGDNNIRIKKNRIVPAKLRNSTEKNSDILSKILGEMDKDRPKNLSKSVVTPSLPNQALATSIDDKDWRKGIITIAESMYNVTTEKDDFKRPTRLSNHPKMMPSMKQRILMSRLSKLSTEDNIPDEIIVEFKRLTEDNIAELILQRVSQDTTDKPNSSEDKFPSPLMTKTQRILLGLMVRLKNENVPNIFNTFLSKADTLLFGTGCALKSMLPITRLYLAICRLQADIDRMRNFCCDAFYFLDDRAIPVLFAVLTSWIEVLPKEPDIKYYPLAKVLVQIVHLRTCNIPGYNLLPLRNLLHQYHEYPTERWNCDELFQELFQQYLRNPVKSAALRLLCKTKDMQWTFKKVNEFFKPLVYKIPAENVNFRATVIVLIGDICSQYKPKNNSEEASWKELKWWLNSLIEGEESDLIEKSVNCSLTKLEKTTNLRKKPKGLKKNRKKLVDKIKKRKVKKKNLRKKKKKEN